MNSKLIYDIGMHVGQDTKYYLKQGYNVLAIEANPVLVKENEQKFEKEIQEGRLTILNVGISDKEASLPFYVNMRLSEWSSFDMATGTRNDTAYEVIEVPCITTKRLFNDYGIPYYLKVDIEGYDHYCLLDIPEGGDKPQFVSCEAVHVEWLDILFQKGYRKFKLIHQGNDFKPLDLELEKKTYFPKYQVIKNGLQIRLQKYIAFKHEYGSSGPFGNHTKGEWKSYEEIRDSYQAFYQNEKKEPLNPVSWFDFHASL